MKYVSTRGAAGPVDFLSASLMGLAPDGGMDIVPPAVTGVRGWTCATLAQL